MHDASFELHQNLKLTETQTKKFPTKSKGCRDVD